MSEPTIAFGRNPAGVLALDDAAFLRAVQWNRQTPPPLAKAARAGDVARFVRGLGHRRCLLRKGGGGKRLAQPAIERPSLWSAASFADSARSAELTRIWMSFGATLKRPKGKRAVDSYRRAKQQTESPSGKDGMMSSKDRSGWFAAENELARWLEGITQAAPIQPFELLVLCEILLAAGRELSPPLCWAVWRSALTGALALSAEASAVPDDAPADRRIVIAGELPYLAGLLFAGIKGSAKVGRSGAKLLAKELLDATDTDGTPQAELLERLPLWMAGLSRVRQWAAAFKSPLWNDEAEERFDLLLQAVAPLCRADGTLALSNGFATNAAPILSAGATAAGIRRKSHPMRLLRALPFQQTRKTGKKKKRPGKRSSKRGPGPVARKISGPRPGGQSDWAQLACLRTDWSPQADVLVVAHHGELPQIDLAVAGVPILSGDWGLELSVSDKPVDVTGDWECTCWFSDKDVDFIELHRESNSGVVVDRQLLLSRKQQFALFADCLSGNIEGPIAYRSELPVLPETSIDADTDTRELVCTHGGTAFRCYPLSLPCDRVHSAPGRFEESAGRIALSQKAVDGLMAPVLIDWSPARDETAEWRRLTVAADGRSVSPAAAAGYRLRVGDLHLVAYRSLDGADEARSLLGLHTQHETVIGRFTPKGEIDALLIVE